MTKKFSQLLKTSTRSKKDHILGENATWIFKEFGVYDEDPEKDKKITEELILFLKSHGWKPARIKSLNKSN